MVHNWMGMIYDCGCKVAFDKETPNFMQVIHFCDKHLEQIAKINPDFKKIKEDTDIMRKNLPNLRVYV